ncbi:uncharacterized protein TRUGW13939_04885 [Talaromyces rugulosus]|uniref:NmrA-like domain-containing protein n=1 Tax=Talaromyces rugulosus TaxID=121627 RepID=A0A7H8QWA7_TALRU|nr:uncharacterized protein TRUGW13939_04885 [Talaromyces rugulosus]QKX57765.1 hypothetical protein TRUGW13939_04885 [Talaromyces rugulosus]
MPSTQIALAGATGNLGIPILKALLDAGFPVTVLSRNGGNAAVLTPYPKIVIKKVNFDSVESLTSALHGVDVVISCVATLAIGSQNPLIDASVAAGVRRFIPAEFGMDSANELCAQLPVCAPKVDTQKYLQEMSKSNPNFTYTAIANGLFLDWGLKNNFILNMAEHSAILYNGGNVPFSTTNLTNVATAVLGVIRHQPQTANRIVYIHSALVTQNELIQYAKEIDGKDWKTDIQDTEDTRKGSLVELAKGPQGDIDAAMLGFCVCGSLTTEYGCDFSSHLDNILLGVKKLNKAELRALVASYL